MNYTAQAERHYDELAIYEDGIDAIDATENVSEDEAQAVLDKATDKEVQAIFAFLVANKVDCPVLKNLQRKAEDIIRAVRIEELKRA